MKLFDAAQPNESVYWGHRKAQNEVNGGDCRIIWDETLPLCYYLYSFEGAINDKHWDAIGDKIKQELKAKIGCLPGRYISNWL